MACEFKSTTRWRIPDTFFKVAGARSPKGRSRLWQSFGCDPFVCISNILTSLEAIGKLVLNLPWRHQNEKDLSKKFKKKKRINENKWKINKNVK